MIPDGAGIVQPVTGEERDASGLFLDWLHSFADWAHEEHRTAETVRKWCAKRG